MEFQNPPSFHSYACILNNCSHDSVVHLVLCSLKTLVEIKTKVMSKKKGFVGGETYTPNGMNAFKLSLVNRHIDNLLGEVLTIIDASIDGDKNKPVKDLIKGQFRRKQDQFCDFAWTEWNEEDMSPATGSESDPLQTGLVKM